MRPPRLSACWMTAGWTGPAQVRLLKDGRLDKHLQIELDNLYVERRSLAYNLKVIGQTFYYLLRRKKPDLAPDSTEDRVEFGRKLLE